MADSSKLRILVIAEACNPTWTSVPLVGYNFVNALSQRNDIEITVASHPRNRDALMADSVSDHAEFVFPDNEYIAAPVYKLGQLFRGDKGKGWTTNTAFKAFNYLFFERELYRLMKRRLANNEFDLIHRITPVTPTVGSPISCWTDTPMIVGPLNGGLPWPKEYPGLRQKENEFFVPLRKAYKRFPYYQKTYRRVAAVLAGSSHTATEIPSTYTGKKFLFPENGVDPNRFEIAKGWTPPNGKFKFVTVGRLVPYKGLSLTLAAMKDSEILRNCELHVIGDGPERSVIENEIQQFGLESNVKMLGWMDQSEVSKVLSDSQCFVFPSLREFGGGVVLEAMASGLPSIIVDYGGPKDLIDRNCGMLIPMKPANELVNDLRLAMESITLDASICETFADKSIAKVREQFTWSAKADRMVEIYSEVLGRQDLNISDLRPGTKLQTAISK